MRFMLDWPLHMALQTDSRFSYINRNDHFRLVVGPQIVSDYWTTLLARSDCWNHTLLRENRSTL